MTETNLISSIVYPKDFPFHKVIPAHNYFFLLAPFSEDLSPVRSAIIDSVKKYNMVCEISRDAHDPLTIMSKIFQGIAKSRAVIAVLTDYNPNVFYELGIAQCVKEMSDIILIIDEGQEKDLPFDLKSFSAITYKTKTVRTCEDGKVTVKRDYSDLDLSEFKDRLATRLDKSTGYGGLKSLLLETLRSRIDLEGVRLEFLNQLPRLFDTDSLNLFCQLFLLSYDKKKTESITHEDLYSLKKITQDAYKKAKETWANPLNSDFIVILVQVFFTKCLPSVQSSRLLEVFLNKNSIKEEFPGISENMLSDLQIDTAISLIELSSEHESVVPRAFSVLLRFLEIPASVGVDFLRHKVERFLVVYLATVADTSLLEMASKYAIDHKIAVVRESLANIVGDSKNSYFCGAMCQALAKETNPYTARSQIIAIGKIKCNGIFDVVMDWIGNNWHLIEKNNWGFILRHAREAFEKQDESYSKTYIVDFNYFLSKKPKVKEEL
ncbi:MAG: hypothetical protein HW380_3922 [Magnetococcales bacterium]|nr:hypothetical protein [Magnetococcales bacterium]HIJ82673.1 hypothetical protein [Magnetococcales bacterium]